MNPGRTERGPGACRDSRGLATAWRDLLAASLREFVLGVNDGLVSVTGLVVGVGAARVPARWVLLAGLAAAAAATVSMAVGAYLAAAAESEYEAQKGGSAVHRHHDAPEPGSQIPRAGPAARAGVMAAAVALGSLPPLLPFGFGIPSAHAAVAALLLAAGTAFGLGVAKGRITGSSAWRSGATFVAAAGLAAGGGLLVGRLFGGAFGVGGP
jgi:VIT1/CCC1 family predicted Fe2+/Mn2+ transporter